MLLEPPVLDPVPPPELGDVFAGAVVLVLVTKVVAVVGALVVVPEPVPGTHCE